MPPVCARVRVLLLRLQRLLQWIGLYQQHMHQLPQPRLLVSAMPHPPNAGGRWWDGGGLAKAWHAPTHTPALIGSVRGTAGVCSGWRAHAQRCKCPARRGRATEGTDSAADPLPPLHPDPRPPPPFTWPSLAVATMTAAAAVEQSACCTVASCARMTTRVAIRTQTAAVAQSACSPTASSAPTSQRTVRGTQTAAGMRLGHLPLWSALTTLAQRECGR